MKKLLILFSMLLLLSCTAGVKEKTQTEKVAKGADFGIEPVALRLTANQTMLDLRYKVTDPELAASLLDRKEDIYLLHEASGKVFPVPVMAKLGPMRQITQNPKPGKIYFVLFSNTGKLVQSGDLATLVLGDLRLQHLQVE
jgi:hypothetical protein